MSDSVKGLGIILGEKERRTEVSRTEKGSATCSHIEQSGREL